MDSSFFFTSCVAATTFFMFYRKFRFRQEKKVLPPSSTPPLALSSPPSSLSRNRKHHVFPSFHGAEVRKTFLSHVLPAFRRKGIDPFIDNDIDRSKSINPALIEAIRGSRIAIVVLSKGYASSTWCMNELVEIMKCREELGQIVMTIFYEVDPTDVKKQTGDFGKAFRKTCKGKTKEETETWRKVLKDVATIAGYHSSKWDTEAAMIDKIATDVSNMLNNSTPSRDFDRLVGMGAHMEKIEPLLRLDLEDEVRMIGIWGPPGIGKTTIARYLFNRHSKDYQLSVFMEKESMYTRPVCSDDYSEKLYLHKQFMSQITNHKDIQIPNLGVAEYRLKEKKMLIVLDSIDKSIQLEAMANETRWFGHGSRIIITTQDQKLLKAHGINNIYKVGFPSAYEAYQIFCTHAFGQKFPQDGFEELAWEVTKLLGGLPLGLRVMGSHFRGMSKEEWINALPRLQTRIDASIESILKFSYDALDNEEKDLFLYIACFFNYETTEVVEDILAKNIFFDVRYSLGILADKSLISIDPWIMMHELLVKMGREIIRHELGQQSIREPGRRRFLVDAKDVCQVLSDDTKGSRNVIGINFNLTDDEFDISERAFKRMPNLEFLRFRSLFGKLYLPQGLNYLSPKLKLLEWECFPMKCLPSNFRTEYLVRLRLEYSKLEKLWEGNKPLGNLKWMSLSCSKNLKELPNLSTATNIRQLYLHGCSSLVELFLSDENVINLQYLDLIGCSSLVELPSSIGNATSLTKLYLAGCSSLVELPFFIGNATNLEELYLDECTSLVELPSSIGNATNLDTIDLSGCTSLVKLPSSIGNLVKLSVLKLDRCSKLEALPTNINMKSLEVLGCNDCVLLRSFPEISTNIRFLQLKGTAIKQVPSSIKSWSRFHSFQMSYLDNLQDFPHALDIITTLYMSDREIQEIPSCVKRISRLKKLILDGCKKLVSLPQLSDVLTKLDARNCDSLERLDCSFQNPRIELNFANCLRLNKEARELIIRTSWGAVLPGVEVPACFTCRTTRGSSMRVSVNQSPISATSRVKACISLVDKGVLEAGDENIVKIDYYIQFKRNGFTFSRKRIYENLPALLTEHLFMVEVEAKVGADETCTDIVFDFKVTSNKWEIGEGGILQISDHDKHQTQE